MLASPFFNVTVVVGLAGVPTVVLAMMPDSAAETGGFEPTIEPTTTTCWPATRLGYRPSSAIVLPCTGSLFGTVAASVGDSAPARLPVSPKGHVLRCTGPSTV